MKSITYSFLFVLTLFFSGVNAQDFQGIATYKTQRKLDIKIDSTKMPSGMHAKMMEMMKKQFQKTYTLSFNKEASVYKEDLTLDKPQIGGDGMQVMIMGSGGAADILYKNSISNSFVDQKDTMGKVFLVQDSIKPIDWTLEKDTKFIGEYACFKATYTKEVRVMKSISFSSGTNTKKTDEENEAAKTPELEFETRTITAWYTPQIPVSSGPAEYQGLPGLILEVHDGDLHIMCSKIVLNPKEPIAISAPTKGKVVSLKEYEVIMEKKGKEMMDRFAPAKGARSNGEAIEIHFGG